ncbi:hypothetical protein CEXT_599151 [Caerostris extrusa]|uniref:CRAL-TRIO domain-containing protein n=1 Tax=Caerostris extrusa TaxID=172846 RepID=A0AAV4XWH7_CAEEX|nr:hypothetical protein CEXT_599151 [Caerostris extrusa]
MTKPILPDQFQKLFIFLSSTEELFNYLPRSIVPSEYGGYLEDYYMTDWLNKAHKQHQRFPKAGEPNFFDISSCSFN